MSVRAALARRLPDLAELPALLADLEAEVDLALERQQLARMEGPPHVLLAIRRGGCTEVFEVELEGVEWIEPRAAPEPEESPRALRTRVWEEELPNRLRRPLGAASGLGAMLDNAARPTLIARLIGED